MDIARQMAQANRVRHLLSGGYVAVRLGGDEGTLTHVTAGHSALALLHEDSFGHRFLGILDTTQSSLDMTGVCPHSSEPVLFENTLSHTATLSTLSAHLSLASNSPCRVAKSMYLQNGDLCYVGGYVIWDEGEPGSSPVLARVEEILQVVDSENDSVDKVDHVLVRFGVLNGIHPTYGMPKLTLGTAVHIIPYNCLHVSFLHFYR
jgi:hypothetical protein